MTWCDGLLAWRLIFEKNRIERSVGSQDGALD